jgi:hypothetical protein
MVPLESMFGTLVAAARTASTSSINRPFFPWWVDVHGIMFGS